MSAFWTGSSCHFKLMAPDSSTGKKNWKEQHAKSITPKFIVQKIITFWFKQQKAFLPQYLP